MSEPKRVAILISGRGSNMKALIEKAQGYEVALVASNKVHAPGLDTARTLGVPTFAFEAKREEFEEALERALSDHRIGTIALAGYMRILTPAFIARWRGEPTAVAAMEVRDGIASLQHGGTPPAFRCHGCHLALIHHRLHAAQQLGCTFVIGGAAFNSPSFRNQLRARLQIAYIESTWCRRRAC